MRHLQRRMAAMLLLILCLGLSGCSAFQMQMAKTSTRMSRLKSFHVEVEAYVGTLVNVGGQDIGMEGTVTGGLDAISDPAMVRTDLVLETLGVERELRFNVWKENDRWRFAPWDETPEMPAEDSQTNDTSQSEITQALNLLVKCEEYFAQPVENTVNGAHTKRYDGVIPREYLDEALRLLHLSSSVEDMPPEKENSIDPAAEIIPEDAVSEEAPEADLSAEPGSAAQQSAVAPGLPVSIWIDDDDRIVQVDVDLAVFLQDLMNQGFEQLLREYDEEDLNLKENLQFADARLTLSGFDETAAAGKRDR